MGCWLFHSFGKQLDSDVGLAADAGRKADIGSKEADWPRPPHADACGSAGKGCRRHGPAASISLLPD
jgi:hypothetical protein